MRFITASSGVKKVEITHQGKTNLEFGIGMFTKMSNLAFSEGISESLLRPDCAFRDINNYLAYLDSQEETSEVNTKLYDLYETVYNILFHLNEDVNTLILKLQTIVSEIIELLDLDKLTSWLVYHSDIMLPELPDTYNQFTQGGTRETTYLRTDYRELIGLSICLRAIIPIWGEFVNSVNLEIGNNQKEYFCYLLLGQSRIHKSNAMVFLKRYVALNLEKLAKEDYFNSVSMLTDISVDDLPIHITALCIVRRVVVKEISIDKEEKTLVRSIYSYIMQKTQQNQRSLQLREKTYGMGGKTGGGETQSPSKLESFSIRAEVNTGTIEVIKNYCSNPTRILMHLGGEKSDVSLYRLFEQALRDNIPQNHIVTNAQLVILKWLLYKVCSSRLLDYLNNQELLDIIPPVQTILWKNNHSFIAALLGAVPDNSGFLNSGSRTQNTKEEKDKLDQLYPYQRLSSVARGARRQNVALDAIELICQELHENSWYFTLPDEFLPEIKKNPGRKGGTPGDIKNILAALIFDLAERKF